MVIAYQGKTKNQNYRGLDIIEPYRSNNAIKQKGVCSPPEH